MDRSYRIVVLTGPGEDRHFVSSSTGMHNKILINYLYHPLIRSLGNIELTTVAVPLDDSLMLTGLDAILASQPDLLIVGHGETMQLADADFAILQRYLETGGACLWVQPFGPNEEVPASFQQAVGVRFEGWYPDSPPFSTIGEAPLARVLGKTPYAVAYPHRRYWRAMRLQADEAEAITLLAGRNTPDLVVSDQVRCALFATDVMSDLLRHYRHPEYDVQHDNLGRLIANTVRYLLTGEAVTEPLASFVTDVEPVFYAYSYGLQMARSIYCAAHAADELAVIQEADRLIHEAAGLALGGHAAKARELCAQACALIGQQIEELCPVPRYFVRGWHGGVLYPHVGPEGILGYAEWGWPDWTAEWMRRHIRWVRQYGGKRLNEIPAQTWDVLATYNAPIIEDIRQANREGLVETVRGAWSHVYLPIVGEESNIRQLVYGKRTIAAVLGEDVETFLCPFDHFEFHPQLPQLLVGTGYKQVVMRCGYVGNLPEIEEALILWEGQDGSTILTAPTHEPTLTFQIGPPEGVEPIADAVAAVRTSGLRSLLMGGSQDATMDYVCEREHTIANGLALIDSRHASCREYFAEHHEPDATYTFTVDQLLGRFEQWSGYGSIAETGRRDRIFEARLLDAEALDALAAIFGRETAQAELYACWKSLLTSQDHFIYGCGASANPEGYHVGGLLYPLLENYPGPRTPVPLEEFAANDLAEKAAIRDRVAEDALSYLSARIDTSGLDASILCVFNPVAWQRTEVVEVVANFAPGQVYYPALVDDERVYPVQLAQEERYDDDSLRSATFIFAPTLPALGYKVFAIQEHRPSAAADQRYTIENEFYRVSVHPGTGVVTEITDKRSGTNLVDARQGANLIEYAYPTKVRAADSGASVQLVERGPIRSRIVVQGMLGAYPYTSTITLSRGVERVDFDLAIDCGEGALFGLKGEPDTLLKVRFPWSFEGTPLIHQAYGVYPTQELRQGVLDFAAVSGEAVTAVLARVGIPGSLNMPNELALLIGDGMPPVYGLQQFSYSVFAVATAAATPAQMIRQARGRMHRFYAVWDGAHAGTLAQTGSFAATASDIVPTALFVEDNRASFRFFNASNVSVASPCQVQLPLGTPEHVGLDGTLVAAEENVRPWKIATLSWEMTQ